MMASCSGWIRNVVYFVPILLSFVEYDPSWVSNLQIHIPPYIRFVIKTTNTVSWVDADKSYVIQTIEMYKTNDINSILNK